MPPQMPNSPNPTPPNNIPKDIAKAHNYHGIFNMIIFFLIICFMGWMVQTRTGETKVALLLVGVGALVTTLFITLGLISNRQLKNAQQNPSAFTHLESGTAVEYKAAAPAAVVTDAEKVVGWFGPVIRSDSGATSFTLLSHEVNNMAENSLIFTNNTIIGVMIGPDDVANLSVEGLQKFAGNLLDISPDQATDKGSQFIALYNNKWPEIMNTLLAQPLPHILTNHLNFGVPYSQIKSIKINNRFISPGITIHLQDGKKLTYSTFHRDKLDEVAATLAQFTTVEK